MVWIAQKTTGMIELKFEITITKMDFSKIALDMDNVALACANDLMKMEEQVVSNWTGKPDFYVSGETSDLKFTYTIIPVGPNVNRWRAVSRGAKGKTFGPVKVPALRFPYQGPGKSYVPKTAPGLFYGGPGVKVGPIQRFQQVFWPGIESRHFEESIMRKYLPTFISKMNNALTRARVR